MEPLLSVERVTFSYDGTRTILREVSLPIRPGELVVLLGPNGAGKSTLLNCIAGLLSPASGRVVLGEEEVRRIPPNRFARQVAYVPQTLTSVYAFQVRDYIAMGRAPHLGLFRRPGREDLERVDRAMEDLGIAHLARKPCTQLSGGERQMVSVCRAVVQEPRLILFDEPTSALDFGNQARTISLIKRLSLRGYAVLMTTHNPDHAVMLDGTVGVLDREGRLRTGSAEEIVTEELLSRVYRIPVVISHVERAGRKACLTALEPAQAE